MCKAFTKLGGGLATVFALLAMTAAIGKEPFEVPLENPSFTKGVDGSGVPLGWSKYGGGGKDQELKIVDGPDGGKALLIADGDPSGRDRRVPSLQPERRRDLSGHGQGPRGGGCFHGGRLPAVPVPAFPATGPDGPGRRVRRQVLRGLGQGHGAAGYHARRDLPVHAPRARLRSVLVTDVRLVGGLPPPPPPPPPPVPPQYDKLKDLHLEIRLVTGGQAERGHRGAGVRDLSERGRGHPAGDREPHRREAADRLRRRPGSRRAHPTAISSCWAIARPTRRSTPCTTCTTAWSISSTRGRKAMSSGRSTTRSATGTAS